MSCSQLVRGVEGLGFAGGSVEAAADELGELRGEIGLGQKDSFFLVEIAPYGFRTVATGKDHFEVGLAALELLGKFSTIESLGHNHVG